ncbi:hypothetical protein BDR04DRAFT_1090735 [Suillus decipiens]|nr:hypothetical protein BDR04DRAFT_1090735 [Suillus decipiens]
MPTPTPRQLFFFGYLMSLIYTWPIGIRVLGCMAKHGTIRSTKIWDFGQFLPRGHVRRAVLLTELSSASLGPKVDTRLSPTIIRPEIISQQTGSHYHRHCHEAAVLRPCLKHFLMGRLRLFGHNNHEKELLGIEKEPMNHIRVTIVHAL